MQLLTMFNVEEVHYDITNLCNAACPQCVRTNPRTGKPYKYISKGEMSLEDFKKASPVEFLASLKFIYFCGNYGDPIVANDLLPILEYCWQANPKLSIKVHSNCSLRNEQWWTNFATLVNNKKFMLIASIDGASQQTQEHYRVGTDYNKIVNNLKLFISLGGIVEWRFIVFKHNEHEVETAKEFARSIGCVNFRSYRSNRAFNKDNKFYYRNKGERKMLEPATVVTDVKFLDKKTIEFHKLSQTTSHIECVANKTKSIFIDFEGNVLPCCHYGIRLYTLKQGARDVNGDQLVYDILNSFGPDNFNSLLHGFDVALENCGKFLVELESYWSKETPFVCKMICGKL